MHCIWNESNEALRFPSRKSPQALAKFLLQEHEESVVTLGCQNVVGTWAVNRIMVPIWIPMMMRHLKCRVPKEGPNPKP